MVIKTTTTKSTPTTTRPTTTRPTLRGGSPMAKPMQKGGSSMAKPMDKPMQMGGSKKHTHKKSKKTKKTKKSKKPMPKGFAYCLMCGKQTEMLNPETRTTKNGRKQLVGKGKCGHKVYRFI